MQRLAAWHSGHLEPSPTPTEPSNDGFAPIAFATPPTSEGGFAHLVIGDASTGRRPTSLTAVFVPSETVAEADRTPANLLDKPDYPQDSVQIPDESTVAVSIKVPGVTPGRWDVGIIATYPDA